VGEGDDEGSVEYVDCNVGHPTFIDEKIKWEYIGTRGTAKV